MFVTEPLRNPENSNELTTLTLTPQKQRLISLDVLRGLTMAGILSLINGRHADCR